MVYSFDGYTFKQATVQDSQTALQILLLSAMWVSYCDSFQLSQEENVQHISQSTLLQKLPMSSDFTDHLF